MSEEHTARGVKFYAVTFEGLVAIEATGIQVKLPSGLSFRVDAEPGRDGNAVFHIEGGSPNDDEFHIFQIEPGAANLFAVDVKRAPKRQG